MEKSQVTRTVKKKFLAADKAGKFVKGAGVYLATFAAGVLVKEALESATKQGADTEDSDDDDE
jgi:hypothetical protein